MARRKARGKSQNDTNDQHGHHPRSFWSGVIAFGLVSLPVSLFPANRGKPIRLGMVDAEGNRLRRRYFNEEKNQMLEAEDLVRGYPIEDNKFVLIEDEDLEALAPEKTREIDLQRFVPLEEINPVFFERGYFLAPDSDTTKAYRLLAKALEETKRAGIATFVMRDREYLIAILSEGGILRAETLRFHDEIRSPDQVGLPEELPEPGKQQLQKTRKAIDSLSRKTFDPDKLVETQVRRLRELINHKLDSHDDVITEDVPDEDQEPDNVVDLMQVLKERLEGQRGGRQRHSGRKSGALDNDLSRDQLYEKARQEGITGRSKMTKQELIEALGQAS